MATSKNNGYKLESTATTYGQRIYKSNKDFSKKFLIDANLSNILKIKNTISRKIKSVTVTEPSDPQSSFNVDIENSSIVNANSGDKINVAGGANLKTTTYTAIVPASDFLDLNATNQVLKNVQNVDLIVSLPSQFSEIVEANVVESVEIDGDFVYNFYQPKEENISFQEDPTNNPLINNKLYNVPMYVKLTWGSAQISNNKNLNNLFATAKDKKQYSNFMEVNQDPSVESQIFGYISNKSLFTNTLSAVIQPAAQNNNLVLGEGDKTITVDNVNVSSLVRVNFTCYGFYAVSSYLNYSSVGADLKNQKIVRGSESAVASSPDLAGLNYYGYVIDKERFDFSTNSWKRIDEYEIVGADSNTFIDALITYGQAYRYRIKSVIKATVKNQNDNNYVSYFYESLPSKQWKYFFIEDYQLPPYPQSIKIVPHTLERKIAIYWLSPATSELDIKSVRVYRRSNIGDDWKLLGSESEMGGDVDVNENMFVDDLIKSDPDDVELKIKSGNASYIYALTAVDVHGLESFMSIQTQVQLNSKFNIEKQEKKLKFISGGGTRIDETSLILNKLGKQEEIVIAKQKVTLSVSDTFADKQKDFIVKITNLDTHETKEVKLSAINTVAQPHYG